MRRYIYIVRTNGNSDSFRADPRPALERRGFVPCGPALWNDELKQLVTVERVRVRFDASGNVTR